MRIERPSPRSSVTVGSLLSDQGRHAGWGSSSERRFCEGGRVGERTESGGGLGGDRGGRCARSLADPGQSPAKLLSGGGVQLGQGVADDPGTVSVGGPCG